MANSAYARVGAQAPTKRDLAQSQELMRDAYAYGSEQAPPPGVTSVPLYQIEEGLVYLAAQWLRAGRSSQTAYMAVSNGLRFYGKDFLLPAMDVDEADDAAQRIIDRAAEQNEAEAIRTADLQPDPRPATVADPVAETHNSDLGFGLRFVEQFGDRLRFVKSLGGWFYYNGQRWEADDIGFAYRLIAETAQTVWGLVPYQREDARKRFIKFAEHCESAAGQTAALKLAGTRPGVAARASEFDRDPWLFNVANGTIDLHTGRRREHNPADLITQFAPVIYRPDAVAPLWLRSLEVFLPQRGMIDYFQRVLGYLLTGDVSEHVLFFLYGGGRNGKSTVLEAVRDVMGSYARTADPELLLAQKGDVHPARIAELRGARFVSSVEVEDGRRFAEALLKQLTGGDTLTARRMYGDYFEFKPTHKLCIAANHKPGVRGTDAGVWSRIQLVPFTVHLPTVLGDDCDPHFGEKLKAEYPGILAWMVQGCLEWQRRGLDPPASVSAAVSEYRAENDAVGRYVDERCVAASGASSPAAALYSDYRSWCDATGEYRQPQVKFIEALEQRGFERVRTGSGKYWRGIGLRDAM